MNGRITGGEVREGCPEGTPYPVLGHTGTTVVPSAWLYRLSEQVDRDADLAARLAAAERERDLYRRNCATESMQSVTALRAKAEQWEAFEAVRDHPAMDKAFSCGVWKGDAFCSVLGDSRCPLITAPDFPALRAKLDALAEAAKPNEVWRWRWPDGAVSAAKAASPSAITGQYPNSIGTPVRETVDARGVVTLTPEGS